MFFAEFKKKILTQCEKIILKRSLHCRYFATISDYSSTVRTSIKDNFAEIRHLNPLGHFLINLHVDWTIYQLI